jgi:hypothetical protein
LAALLAVAAADAPGFLFISFLSFTLHATLRHPQLHVGHGKWKATKNENKTPKTPKRMGEPFLGWTEITEVMIQYDDHTARRTR